MSGKQLFWDSFFLGRVDSISLGPGSEDASEFLHILGNLSSISRTIYQLIRPSSRFVCLFVCLFFFFSLLLRSYSFSHSSMVIKANEDNHLNRLHRARIQLSSLFLFQNQDT